MTCGFMPAACNTPNRDRAKIFYSKKAQKCIRMRITIFKMFIWVGISSDIWFEITFIGSAHALS